MVLSDQEDLEHGIELLKKHNLTEVGLHTSLFAWSKTNRPGRPEFIEFFKNANDQEIADRAMSEIKVFEDLMGYKPKFISPQFNMHGNLRFMKVIADYVVANNIPMRIPRALIENEEIEAHNYSAEIYLKRLGVKMTNHLFAHILGPDAKAIMNSFVDDLSTVKDGESVEILLHPGYHDSTLLESSSLNFERARDLSITLNPSFKARIQELGFTYSHMSDLWKKD